MGSSKTHRGGPSFAKNNTGAGKTATGGDHDSGNSSYSQGRMSTQPKGGELSSGTGRGNLPAGTRNKSSASRSSVKTKTSFGQS